MTNIFESPVKEVTKKVPCVVDPFPEDHQIPEEDHQEPMPPHCFNIVR